jgi:hypothetical protein
VLLEELFGLGMAGRAVEALWGYVEELFGEVVGSLSAELSRCRSLSVSVLGVDRRRKESEK